ncbi:hypothetical protein [Salipaludibacillus daqingensis]|uniref:hypothetical protein n=1 Tax=Salipaludibacillus daqingensis TaxID=3041001 RepID=UPI002476886C|nr:hypothetical protein [Salipaludibacillus daqingensis]
MGVKNEKGYVLLLTLVVILIIGVLIPPLLGSALSSAKQAQRSEEHSQVVKMSDMGVMYARNNVIKKIEGIETHFENNITTDPTRDNVISHLRNELTDFAIDDLTFERYEGQVKGTFTEIRPGENDEEIDIIYEVDASILNDKGREETAEEIFTIRSSSSSAGNDVIWSDRFDEPPYQQRDGSEGRETRINGKPETVDIAGNVTFPDDPLDIKGSERDVLVTGNVALEKGADFNPDSVLVVGGNMLMNGSEIKLGNRSHIIVKKDLYLIDAVFDIKDNSNHDAYICVEGNVRMSYSSETSPELRTDKASCSEIEESGFYVLGDILNYDASGIDGGSSNLTWIPVGTTRNE